MKRNIVTIDRDRCNGCGLCIGACHEGAIQLVEGKAELVSDIYCDGLGDCLGECPMDAITIEEREAEAYDEAAVQRRLENQAASSSSLGAGTTGTTGASPAVAKPSTGLGGGCPGMRKMTWDSPPASGTAQPNAAKDQVLSALRQWPVQLKLVPVNAPYWENADILLSADCVAHAYGSFHQDLLAGKRLIVACPKLDQATDEYIEKLAMILRDNEVKSLTVAYMEVPCCQGIVRIADEAVKACGRIIPVETVRIGLQGERQ